MKRMFLVTLVMPSLLLCGNSSLFDEEKPTTAVKTCMERNEIKNTHTPADLFKSSAMCIEEEKYTQAVELYLVATAYGYFDSARVLDKTARDVLDVIKTDNFTNLDVSKRDKFAEALRARLDDMRSSCSFLAKLGYPNYHPRYMIQAGTEGVIVKSKNGLVPRYDANLLWEETRATYLKCQ